MTAGRKTAVSGITLTIAAVFLVVGSEFEGLIIVSRLVAFSALGWILLECARGTLPVWSAFLVGALVGFSSASLTRGFSMWSVAAGAVVAIISVSIVYGLRASTGASRPEAR